MGREVKVPWIRGFDIQWVGRSKYHGEGFDISWVGGQNTMGMGSKYHG